MSDDSVEIVHRFWDEVWNAHAPEAVERFVTEDFVITSGGVDTVGRAEFKKWIAALLDRIEGCACRSPSRSRTPTAAGSPPAG